MSDWTPEQLARIQDATRPYLEDPLYGEWPPRMFPLRHVTQCTTTQLRPGAGVSHGMVLSCGHEETMFENPGADNGVRISTWHCTQCPKVALAVRGFDLMGERR